MATKSNILVIGGTGKTGRKVVEGLKQHNQNVRIGTRNSKPLFQWDDPATWPEALEGMDKVYIVYYPDLAVPGAYEAIKALTEEAKKAGVKKAVLLSGKGEKEAERCEEVVAKSGLEYTLVRASWFNQNFTESFLLEPILAGHVALPMPQAILTRIWFCAKQNQGGQYILISQVLRFAKPDEHQYKIPFVDTTDIAEVVVKVLLDEAHNGKTYEITGPSVCERSSCILANPKGCKVNKKGLTLGARVDPWRGTLVIRQSSILCGCAIGS